MKKVLLVGGLIFCAFVGNGDIGETRKAAEQGEAEAQYRMGVCYYKGDGVKVDKGEAVKWFRKAAEQGFAMAQCNLGLCYYKGEGVARDWQAAKRWLRKAVEQGDEQAKEALLMILRGDIPSKSQ